MPAAHLVLIEEVGAWDLLEVPSMKLVVRHLPQALFHLMLNGADIRGPTREAPRTPRGARTAAAAAAGQGASAAYSRCHLCPSSFSKPSCCAWKASPKSARVSIGVRSSSVAQKMRRNTQRCQVRRLLSSSAWCSCETNITHRVSNFVTPGHALASNGISVQVCRLTMASNGRLQAAVHVAGTGACCIKLVAFLTSYLTTFFLAHLSHIHD